MLADFEVHLPGDAGPLTLIWQGIEHTLRFLFMSPLGLVIIVMLVVGVAIGVFRRRHR